jgi:hypothetical protein
MVTVATVNPFQLTPYLYIRVSVANAAIGNF